MADSHTEGAEKGKFCSLRMETCPCGNKYKDIMNGTGRWGKYPQLHRVLTVVERAPEAHHVLPVASVTAHVTSNTKIKHPIVFNTKWCVNEKANMIALPLFEMTFLHYLLKGDVGSAPPFKNLPMHNYDHAAFQKEVGDELMQIGADAQQNTKAHEKVTKELLAALNTCRDFFKPELKNRGTRGKGTHGNFVAEMNGKALATPWYEPFSMAAKPAAKPFPSKLKTGGLSGKLAELEKAWKAFCKLNP